MFTALTITDLFGARKLKRRFDAVISLQDPHCKRGELLRFAKRPAPQHLRLRFDDIEVECAGVVAPQESHVAEALAFARSLNGTLLIHCHGGISRSGAMSYALLADLLGPGREEEALEQLLAQRPMVVPNGRVVKFADKVMERGGALLAVYQDRLAKNAAWQEIKIKQRAYWMRKRPQFFPTELLYDQLR
jgi:predicted protein tyrosine phosphatase